MEINYQLFGFRYIELQTIIATPSHEVIQFLVVHRLIVIHFKTYHLGVIVKLHDLYWYVSWDTIVGEKAEQNREDTTLWYAPCVHI